MPARKRTSRSIVKTAAEPSSAKKPRTRKAINESSTSNETTHHDWFYPSLLENKGHAEMVLSHILRAHSLATHDGQDDEEQDTAACAFEPTIKGQSLEDSTDDKDDATKRSSKIVATCGGNTVCLIDCQLGRIIAKYSHVEEEVFRCLAWTTTSQQVAHDDENESGEEEAQDAENPQQHLVNILAAAGRLGSIKLINPIQNSCYHYLHGHTAEVVQLAFSLNNPEWLYSASLDGSIRMWDIGSLNKDGRIPRCLAKLGGLDSPVTAMAVSEKYLVAGTESGNMVRFNIRALERRVFDRQARGGSGSSALLQLEPDRFFPNSQEWHESTVDDIVYLPRFSPKSFFGSEQDEDGKIKAKRSAKKGPGATTRTNAVGRSSQTKVGQRRRGRPLKEVSDDEVSDSDNEDDDDDTEYIFASHESHQGEILIWDATSSTEADAKLKTILEWPISESQTKFAFAQNMAARTPSTSVGGEQKRPRENVLVVGSTTGEVLLYDLGLKPKRSRGNIVAQKPARILSSPMSTQLLRTITASKDLSTIVAGDWTNRVLVWKYPSYLDI